MVRDAEDFLLRVRGVLHAEAGRDANVLTHELQERVADAIGCAGETPRQRVEALMGDYFRHARAIARELGPRAARRPAAGRTRRRDPRRPPLRDRRRRHPLRRSPRAPPARPSLWLEIFRLALADGCPVSEQALDCIEQNLDRYTADDFAGTEAERQQLRALFYPRPGPLRAAVGDARLRAAEPRPAGVRRAFTAASSATSITSTRSTSTRC